MKIRARDWWCYTPPTLGGTMYQNNYIILIYSLYVYNEIEKDEELVDGGGK